MKKIDILTIFPELVEPYLGGSIMKRAQDADVVDFGVHDIRDFSDNKHGRIDDTPYGGGAGMVMQVGPIYEAVQAQVTKYKKQETKCIVLLSAKGKRYTQRDAERLARYDNLIFICGRYEGVDERVAQYIADEEISVGDFVLTGGELGAMVIADSVVRLLPGALGNVESAMYESHSTDGYKEHPQYTKPEEFNGWNVPDVLLSGHHGNIQQWRKENSNNKSDGKEKK
ncbi:MAG: tRNA (guanosine(37)-N1)-methyltransferase TrmD [Patescibacteria group bacterium]|nr:tRNA (guanosine(37)-N1)-methyltransferase TrmD [Patescibacteria group bacterium]